MKNTCCLCYFLLFLSIGCTNLSQKNGGEAKRISVSDFFKNPEKSNYKLNPSGNKIAYNQRLNNTLNIAVRDLTTNKIHTLTSQKIADIRRFYWLGDDKIIYYKDTDGKRHFQLFVIDFDGKNQTNLTPYPEAQINLIGNEQTLQDNQILVSMNLRDAQKEDVYRLNLTTGKLQLLIENNQMVQTWFANASGKLLLAIVSKPLGNGEIWHRKSEELPFKPIFTLQDEDIFKPIAFINNDQTLLALSNIGRDKQALVEFDLTTLKEKKIICQSPLVDVSRPLFSPKSDQVALAVINTDKAKFVFFDGQYEKIYQKIKQKTSKADISISSFNTQETKFIINVSDIDWQIAARIFAGR